MVSASCSCQAASISDRYSAEVARSAKAPSPTGPRPAALGRCVAEFVPDALTAADFVTVPIAMAMVLYPCLLTAGLCVGLFQWPGKHHAQSQHGNAAYGNAGSDHCPHRATLCHAVCGPTQWFVVGFTTSPVDSRSATPSRRCKSGTQQQQRKHRCTAELPLRNSSEIAEGFLQEPRGLALSTETARSSALLIMAAAKFACSSVR